MQNAKSICVLVLCVFLLLACRESGQNMIVIDKNTRDLKGDLNLEVASDVSIFYVDASRDIYQDITIDDAKLSTLDDSVKMPFQASLQFLSGSGVAISSNYNVRLMVGSYLNSGMSSASFSGKVGAGALVRKQGGEGEN